MKQLALNLDGTYPRRPGYTEPTTSKEAADAIAPTLNIRQARVMQEFEAAQDFGLTADEAAKRLCLSVLSVRPRVSELGKLGRLEKTKARRKNDSGKRAIVWRRKRT